MPGHFQNNSIWNWSHLGTENVRTQDCINKLVIVGSRKEHHRKFFLNNSFQMKHFKMNFFQGVN